MSNFAGADFRPFVTGEEKIGTYIRSGGYGSAPYWNGMLIAASNFNHLLAYSYKPVIDQHGLATITYSGASITWAKYVVRIPSLVNRDTFRVEVVATTTAGRTFTVSGSIAGGSTGSSAATASGGTATVNIPCAKTDDYQLLTLTFVLSGNGDFLPTSVLGYSAPEAAGGIALDTIRSATASGAPQGTYTPQATAASSQYGVDNPLSVAMISDMSRGLQGLFKDNVGSVVNWSFWRNHATLTTDDRGAYMINSATVTSPKTMCEYIYYPRQGVRKLHVFAAARLKGYVATPGKLSVNWRTGDPSVDPVDVSTSTTVFTSGSWEIWRGELGVPQTSGPLYLQVRGQAVANGPLYLQAFAAFEDFDTVT